jgi:hypothetical protein
MTTYQMLLSRTLAKRQRCLQWVAFYMRFAFDSAITVLFSGVEAIGRGGQWDIEDGDALNQHAARHFAYLDSSCSVSAFQGSTRGPKAVRKPALQRGFLGRVGGSSSSSSTPVASLRSALRGSSRPLNELAQLATAPASQQPDHVAQVGRDLQAHSTSAAAQHASGAAVLQRLRIVPDASDAEVAAAQMMS